VGGGDLPSNQGHRLHQAWEWNDKTFTPLARRGGRKYHRVYRDSCVAPVADDGGSERRCNLLGGEFQDWVCIVSIFSSSFLWGWSSRVLCKHEHWLFFSTW